MGHCHDELEEWADKDSESRTFGFGLGYKLHCLIFIAPLLVGIGAQRCHCVVSSVLVLLREWCLPEPFFDLLVRPKGPCQDAVCC